MKAAAHAEPHIQSESRVSASTLLAFTFWLAWGWALNARALMPAPLAEAEAFMRQIDALYVAIWIATLLLIGAFSGKIGPLHARKLALYGMPILVTVGTGCEILSGWVSSTYTLGLLIGQALTAIGSAGLLVMWGEYLVAAGFRKASIWLAATFAIAAPMAYLTVNLRPTVALVTLTLMPLCTGLVLWLAPPVTAAAALTPQPQPRSGKLWKWLLGAAFIGLAFGLSNGLTKTEASSSFNAYFLLATGLGALLILVSVKYFSDSLDYFALYRTVAPIMVAGLLLLSLPMGHYWALAQVAIAVAWGVIRIFVMTILSELTPRLGMTATRTFAWTQVALSAGREVGWLLSKDAQTANHEVLIVVAGAVLLTVVTVSLVVNERDLVSMFGESARSLLNSTSGVTHAQVASGVAAEFGLSQRQEEVVALIIEGLDNAALQNELHIAGSTLKAHLRDIYAKVGVHSRQELLGVCASYAERASHPS